MIQHGTGDATYGPRLERALFSLRMRETSLATLGFSATLRMRSAILGALAEARYIMINYYLRLILLDSMWCCSRMLSSSLVQRFTPTACL